ncbi:MAG: quinol dehydrogenase ferredoxin subunit NapH [bacterium]|nr:quinol dehydrogenase ferredoxin subunit NapH [bacterium]
MSALVAHRYLILRRTSQLSILGLFWLGAHLHVGVLTGNLSASRFLRTVPLADPFAVLQILVTRHPLASTTLVGAAIVAAFYWLVGGRAFCGWVCPVNLVTDFARWIKRKFDVKRQFGVDRSTRFWVLGLSLVVSAISGVAAFEWVSPIALTHRELIFGPGLGLLALGGLFLADLFVLRHGWCGSLCPLGAFYSLLGRGALVRMRFDDDRCDRCGECVKVCPEPHVIHYGEMKEKGFVSSGDCLNCGRCLEVCPTDAFRFGLRFARPDQGRE